MDRDDRRALLSALRQAVRVLERGLRDEVPHVPTPVPDVSAALAAALESGAASIDEPRGVLWVRTREATGGVHSDAVALSKALRRYRVADSAQRKTHPVTGEPMHTRWSALSLLDLRADGLLP